VLQKGVPEPTVTGINYLDMLQHVQVTVPGNSWFRKEKWSVDFARGNGTKHIHAIFRHD
jgi:hypothetical protein